MSTTPRDIIMLKPEPELSQMSHGPSQEATLLSMEDTMSKVWLETKTSARTSESVQTIFTSLSKSTIDNTVLSTELFLTPQGTGTRLLSKEMMLKVWLETRISARMPE